MKNSTIIIVIFLIAIAFMVGFFLGRNIDNNEPAVFTEKQSDKVGKININTATLDELCLLPGISEITAQKIVDYRECYGEFRYVEELCEISGISEEKLNEILDYIEI